MSISTKKKKEKEKEKQQIQFSRVHVNNLFSSKQAPSS
jgi:hypothetical protein